MSKQKVIKVGNSIGVTVPSDFVRAVGIKAGDEVEVIKKIETGKVIYKFSGIQQLSFPVTTTKKKRPEKGK